MTLSLDDVRNKRFRMARKSGYEVVEVDEFVDEVEATFEQLIDENHNLKKQVESLKTSADGAPAPAAAASETAAGSPQTIVVTTGKEASSAVVRLVEMSTEQAERLVEEATEDANRIREEANRTAEQTTTEARTRAERIESESRVHAERLQADALNRAETLDREIDLRRTELFGTLERERDGLSVAVRELREFEASYRSSMSDQLRQHLATVESGHAEPEGAPLLSPPADLDEQPSNEAAPVGEPAAGPEPHSEDDHAESAADSRPSDTPRLDALLGDQR